MPIDILIGLIEHFGDIVACEPVSRYVRNKYPAARISWAIQEPYRELIDSNPHIDETIILGCLTDWIKLTRHSKFDLVIDLHVNYRICQDCRVPLVKESGNPFVNAFEWFDYGAILEAFCLGAGLPKLSAHPQLYLAEEHRTAADALQLPSDYCVIHRESNSPLKDWPIKKWLSVTRLLRDELKLSIVEVGATKNDEGQINDRDDEASCAAWRSMVISLVDRTSLLQTAEVIRRARFFIGVDSGPAHLANAVKTPGVILLGRINYFRQYMPFTGFYASDSSRVRLVRNLTGSAAELDVDEVTDAVRYVVRILDQEDKNIDAASAPSAIENRVDPHYRRMVLNSGLFDRAWYVTHHPEAPEHCQDPLDYFIAVGAEQGHAPGEGFDAAWYNSQRPDLVVVKDPLKHYLQFGRKEGLRPCPYKGSSVFEKPPALQCFRSPDNSVSSSESAILGQNQGDSAPRIFAFYLPQFHPIVENNYGHRPGFTEWDNVIKAKPLFKGHYQPRIPGELGYYDLRSLDVMRQQVELANDHGIDGFCFYYYYFQGKKLLYKPIDNYLKSDIGAPFFFLWANENWSRRWDGGDNEVIVAQKHNRGDDIIFIRDLLSIFADDRYVKLEGKPLLLIYKTHLFPDIKETTELWRDEIVKHGFPGIYLVMADDWSSDPPHPRELGFDASYEIPSNIVPEQVVFDDVKYLRPKEGFQGRIVDYQKFASFHMGRPFPAYKRFRTVMAPWDNTPRYGSRAMVQVNTDNDAYQLWLFQALADTRRRYAPEERIVFLHSWNEWCEGTYVEPDGRYGRRLLGWTKEAVGDLRGMFANTCTDSRTATYLRRMMHVKDEGAARSLQAMRQQNMYLYRDLEHQRAQLLQLTQNSELAGELAAKQAKELSASEVALLASQQAEAQAIERSTKLAEELAGAKAERELLHSVYKSRSWRITKPLRDLTSLLKKT